MSANRPLRYVALGDSYSAGEGAGDYSPETNTGKNTCHRSSYGYAKLLGGPGRMLVDHPVNLSFWACSGATTKNVLGVTTNDVREGGQHGEPPQIDHLDTGTDLVTLTIGGNDAGFVAVVGACIRHFLGYLQRMANRGTRCTSESIRQRLAVVPQGLDDTFAAIRTGAPNAVVIACGYPHLFPADPVQQRCADLNVLRPASQDLLRRAADELNDEIRKAAVKAGIHYVDVRDVFAGHEICAGPPGLTGSWINPLTQRDLDRMVGLGRNPEPLHPNKWGQLAYANAINDYIQERLSEGVPTTSVGLPANPQPQ